MAAAVLNLDTHIVGPTTRLSVRRFFYRFESGGRDENYERTIDLLLLYIMKRPVCLSTSPNSARGDLGTTRKTEQTEIVVVVIITIIIIFAVVVVVIVIISITDALSSSGHVVSVRSDSDQI